MKKSQRISLMVVLFMVMMYIIKSLQPDLYFESIPIWVFSLAGGISMAVFIEMKTDEELVLEFLKKKVKEATK